MKLLFCTLLLTLIPTQALAGVSCRGGAERGSSAFFFQPIGRERPTGNDGHLEQGTYVLDKLCYDNGNLTLVYMEHEATEEFYYLTLTPEVWNFIQGLVLD